MNIAIYGDSFADSSFKTALESWDPVPTAWPTLLGLEHNVKNYSRAGTSLYWSYKQFLSTHLSHDRVIFLITAVGRWPNPIEDLCFGNSLEALDHHIRSVDPGREDLIKRLSVVRDWYVWARDYSYEQDIHELILREIVRTRPDTILIPTVGDTASLRGLSPITDWARASLFSLTGDSRWHDHANTPPLLTELRTSCHMTPEANRSFSGFVSESLKLGAWSSSPPKSITHSEPLSYYYK